MMAAAYSLDLRRKIVQAYERGARSQVEIAESFGVSLAFVEKLLRQYRQSGALEPVRKRPGRHRLIDADASEQLQHWLEEESDLTLAELADRLQTQCGLHVSPSCVWRLLRRLGLRRKKKTVHASERDSPQVLLARQHYRRQLAACSCGRLKFIDESGCNIATTRRYGRARHGARVHDAVPKNFGRNVTILGAPSC